MIYDRCPTCHELFILERQKLAHACGTLHKVFYDDNGDGELFDIYADTVDDIEEELTRWVAEYDVACADYPIVSGECAEMIVFTMEEYNNHPKTARADLIDWKRYHDDHGVGTKWAVSGESVPEYTATIAL